MWSAKYLIMMEGSQGNMDTVDTVDSEKFIPDIIEADETSPLLKRPSGSESDGDGGVRTHYSRHRRLYIFLLSFLASSLFIGIIFTVAFLSLPAPAPNINQSVIRLLSLSVWGSPASFGVLDKVKCRL